MSSDAPDQSGRSNIRHRLQGLESRAAAYLRHPVARWVGLAVGLGSLALMAGVLIRNGEGLAAVAALGPGSWLAAAGGFLLFHLAAIGLLTVLGARRAAPTWVSAQFAKYLPIPASAAVGMVGSAVRYGAAPSEAVGLMVRQSLALVGGAAVVGAPAVSYWVGARLPAGAAAAVLGCGVVAAAAIALAGRGMSQRRIVLITVFSVAGWALLAVFLALAVREIGDPLLLLGSAYAAGWVAGQIVVPVPAGLGVREAAMLALLQGHIGFHRAAAIAIVTRLLHVLSDGAAAAVVFGLQSRSRQRI